MPPDMRLSPFKVEISEVQLWLLTDPKRLFFAFYQRFQNLHLLCNVLIMYLKGNLGLITYKESWYA